MTDREKMPDAPVAWQHVCEHGSEVCHVLEAAQRKLNTWGGEIIPLYPRPAGVDVAELKRSMRESVFGFHHRGKEAEQDLGYLIDFTIDILIARNLLPRADAQNPSGAYGSASVPVSGDKPVGNEGSPEHRTDPADAQGEVDINELNDALEALTLFGRNGIVNDEANIIIKAAKAYLASRGG